MPSVVVEKQARAQMRRLNQAQRDSLRDCYLKLTAHHNPADANQLEEDQHLYRIQSDGVTTGYDYLPDLDTVRIWVLLIDTDGDDPQDEAGFLKILQELMNRT